jgi:hypothetical protein
VTEFEATVFKWIADKCGDPALEAQLRSASVSSREHTGVGCYSELAVPDDTQPTDADYGQCGPLTGPGFESSVLKNGGGSLLWFEGGVAKTLEVFTYNDEFPADHDALGNVTLREDDV